MKLILIRHGEAAPPVNGDDHRRPLTDLGQAQAALSAKYVMQHYQPDLFVVSPLLRAQQTQAAFNSYCSDVPVMVYNGIKPDDPAKPALEWLSNLEQQCVVVVCHMNVVAYLAGLLKDEFPESFHLAEVRVFEQPVIAAGLSVELNRFIPKLP
jgi:phosphohistidine phosphatase